MARTNLSPEEREERRKARNRNSFSDAAYRHYDPKKEGFGTFDEWIAAAAAAASGTGRFERIDGAKSDPTTRRHLEALKLDAMPATIAELKSAFRAKLFKVHPDYGGTETATIAAKNAYDGLLANFDV